MRWAVAFRMRRGGLGVVLFERVLLLVFHWGVGGSWKRGREWRRWQVGARQRRPGERPGDGRVTFGFDLITWRSRTMISAGSKENRSYVKNTKRDLKLIVSCRYRGYREKRS